jgi:hypothetical protein
MRKFILIIAAAATFAWPRNAWSQVTTTPIPLVKPFVINRGYEDLQTLTRLYNAGEWGKLDRLAKALLGAAQSAAKVAASGNDELVNALDPSTHHIILVWIGADAFDKPMLARIVVHGPPGVEPSGGARGARDDDNDAAGALADLPGVGAGNDPVYEVFFSRGTRGKIADVYVSTRDKNPISEELPAFIRAIAAPLFETIGILGGAVGPTLIPAAQPSIAATVSRVALPFERATIKWKAVAREPVTESDFVASLADLSSDLKFSRVPHSSCAQDFIDRVLERLQTAVKDPVCSADAAPSANSCKPFIGTELTAVFDSQRCGPPSARRAATDPERTELLSIDAEVRTFISENLTMSAESELTFRNRPLTHWSFGAGSGVIASASLTQPRVKLKDALIVADPLPRVTTLAFVNWSPAGYNAEADRLGIAERVRPFFGATLTPDFGIAGGVNVLLARGIGVLGGGAVMFAKGAATDDINKVPADPDKAYDISYARVLFWGISYNFK